MTLNSLISKNQIKLRLSSTDQEAVISEMVDFAVTQFKINKEWGASWKTALMEREKEFSTGIGSGVAIPHAFSDQIEETVIVMGCSAEGVNFETLDSQPVQVVVLFISPQDEFQMHLHVLAAIGKSFKNSGLINSIMKLNSEEEILELIKSKG